LRLQRRDSATVAGRRPASGQTAVVELGILIFPTDLSIRPDRLAIAVEERGFGSLWVTEHTHIPASRRTPWPGGPNLPEEYLRTLDPFVALTAAASVTSRLRLATGICLVAQHDPIVLAKTISSLDVLSDGRFTLGIGVGWNEEEMADHGVDPARRRAVAREKVLAMKQLWTQDEASFEGEFVRFPPAWSWPKPVQQPHPPVVMGGVGGPVTFRHVVEFCDGWMPIHGRRAVLDKLPVLQQAAEAAGRDPATIELGVFGVPDDAAVIDTYREAGFDRCVLGVPPADESRVLAVLDGHAGLVEQYA
jgi:probable F420-dependent oxidoreductase